MPTLRIDDDLEMFYRVDDFTDPWKTSEVVLFLHGVADNGGVWFGWVPHLGRHFRLVRPDMRGFGRSSPMPEDFPWPLDRLRDDYLALLDHLDIERVHLVGAKLGGMLSLHTAATRPDRVRSATVMSTPVSSRQIPTANNPAFQAAFREKGVEAWVWMNHHRRLGSESPDAMKEWWARSMVASGPLSTLTGMIRAESRLEIEHELKDIRCPTLAIATEGSALGSAEQIASWRQHMAHPEIVILPGDAYHVAAAHADEAAAAALAFIRRHSE
jgi:pimeloyl-ACP methyl ester carboxylesterase